MRLAAFGVFLFFLAPAVESSFLPMIDVINEHRLYLAAAGFFAALTTGIFLGLAKWEGRWPALNWAVTLLLLVLAGAYGVATYQRNQVWQSEITLWEDVIKKSPRKARPYDELGLAYARQGRYAEAVPLYLQAIALNPRFATYYSNLGVAYGTWETRRRPSRCSTGPLRSTRRTPMSITTWGCSICGRNSLRKPRPCLPGP